MCIYKTFIMILFYYYSADGKCSDCETESPWRSRGGAAVALALTVIVTLFGYCNYKRKRSNCEF